MRQREACSHGAGGIAVSGPQRVEVRAVLSVAPLAPLSYFDLSTLGSLVHKAIPDERRG
jgi:hypothetical protein